jgi:hypothetical protein
MLKPKLPVYRLRVEQQMCRAGNQETEGGWAVRVNNFRNTAEEGLIF